MRVVALFAGIAWLASVLNTNCIKPPALQLAMGDCAHSAAMTDPDVATDTLEKCAEKTCYTALAGAEDGFSVGKLKLSFDLLWLPLALFSVFPLARLPQRSPVPRFFGFCLRESRLPLIYRFCSLLN